MRIINLKLATSVLVLLIVFFSSCSSSEEKKEVKVEVKTDLQEGIGIQVNSTDVGEQNDSILDLTDKEAIKPLVLADGKEVEMGSIKPDMIESINVLKGDKAFEKYGAKGKNGVIEITLK